MDKRITVVLRTTKESESAQTLKNAGKLMSGISDGVIDGVSGMAAGNPGIFYETSDLR